MIKLINLMTSSKYSQYVVNVKVNNKNGEYLFNIYNSKCCVLIDESISSLLRKITYGYQINLKKTYDYSMLYIFTKTNYNILTKSNIKSINILNEILDEHVISIEKQNLSDQIYTIFGFVNEIELFVLNIYEEIDILKNYFFGKITEQLLYDIYHQYISIYFPILSFQIFKNIFNSTSELSIHNDFSYITKLQNEINEIEMIDNTDVNFFGKIELKNLFIIYYPKLIHENLNINLLNNNIIFLNDMFLEMFELIQISKTLTSVILQTPQLNAQKGVINKSITNINTYKINFKGTYTFNNRIISFTVDFEVKKCRVYLSFTNFTLDSLTSSAIDNILDYINNILSKGFIKIKTESYNIDFFNIKTPVTKQFNIDTFINIAKRFNEYLFIIKESNKSLYAKYRIGYVQNVLNSLFNKIYSILNQGKELTQEQIIQFKIDYELELDDIYLMINDVKMKLNSSYRERGIGLSLTDMFLNISGLSSSDMCHRAIYIINRLINISIVNKSLIKDKYVKPKIENEYIYYITYLDTFLKNKSDVYWCKACQNYGSKIRKPILHKQIPDGYDYEKSTNTYINSAGHRVIEIYSSETNEKVYFGCDTRRSNPNKYIGFIKTCSLCCFQDDQFISKSNVSKRKVNVCWNKIKSTVNQSSSSSYIYSTSKMIGDVSLVIDEFEPYFNDEYLCILKKIGKLDLKPTLNELIFVDNILVNPNMFIKGNEYSIYFYQNPFLHKLVSKYNTSIDVFTKTPIDDFIQSCSKSFDAFAPFNAYATYFKYKKQIEKYSFIESMNIIIFIFYNGLILSLIDRTLYFGEYIGMFGENVKYVNKYNIPTIDQVLKNLNEYSITSVVVNAEGKIYGVSTSSSFYILFKIITDNEFNKITNNKYKNLPRNINVTMSSIVNTELNLVPLEITDDILEAYMYNLFRYNMFIFLFKNINIKTHLLKLISSEPDINKRYTKIKNYILSIINDSFIINDVKINKSKINIVNNIGNLVSECKYPHLYDVTSKSCKLQMDDETRSKLLKNIINELIYPYSSIYIYMSKYVNNSYTPYRITYETSNLNMLITESQPKIVNGKYIQEIYPFGNEFNNIALYRALANIYFWNKMLNENELNRRNLGFYSKSQTYLAYYINTIITESNLLLIIETFNNKFEIQVSLIVDENVLFKSKGKNYIYINIKDGIITNISVGYDIEND